MAFNKIKFEKWLRDRAHFGRGKLAIGHKARTPMNQQNIGKARAFEQVLEFFHECFEDDAKREDFTESLEEK